MHSMSTFGDNLKEALRVVELTPHKLALRIGIDPSYMSKVVSGDKPPSDSLIEKIAEVSQLKLSKAVLLYWRMVDEYPPEVLREAVEAELKRRKEERWKRKEQE